MQHGEIDLTSSQRIDDDEGEPRKQSADHSAANHGQTSGTIGRERQRAPNDQTNEGKASQDD